MTCTKSFLFTVVIISIVGIAKLNAQSIHISDSTFTDSVSVFSVIADPAFIYAPRLRNPFTVSGIDRQDIDQITEPTIEPLLNSIPGLWMQSGTLNTNRISIRGVGYREPFATTGIKVYLDDIPLTNGVGESSFEDIHPFILSGIEIWRGPASAIWGSGLGGMIHLISEFPEGDKIRTRIQAGSYSRLQLDQNVSLTYGKDDQWGTSLHYQYLNDDGYRANNEYRKHSWTWMQHWQNHKGLSLKTFLHGIDLKAFIPSSLNFDDYNNNPLSAAPAWDAVDGNEDYNKWIAGFNIQYAHPEKWIYRGSLFGTAFHSDEVRPFNILDESNNSYGMRHRVSMNVAKKGHLSLGMEYFKEIYKFSTFETLEGGVAGEQLSNQKEHRTYFNGFLQSEFDLSEKWIVFGGLHLTLNHLLNQNTETAFPITFYPTAGLNYLWNEHFSTSASVSRGYSSLSLDDILNSSGVINENIIPESGWNKEVGFTIGKLIASYAGLHVFHMNIENTVITKRIEEDLFEKINGGSSVHRGIELEYRLTDNPEKIKLEGSYTYGSHYFREFIDSGNDYSGNTLPGTPAHRSFNRITWLPLQSLSLYADHHFLSDVFLTDANTIKGEGYHLMHFGIDYRFQSSNKLKWGIGGKIHNVFDTKYSPMYQINALGAQPRYYYSGKPRSYYLGINIEFNL